MNWKREGSFHLGAIAAGFNILVHPTDKFKTTTLKLFCHNPLDGNATRNALLSFVLKQGTRRLPSTPLITRHLETLFGASFTADVLKLGERQIHEFRLQILNDRYVPTNARLLEKGLRFLRDLLWDPFLEGNGFSKEFFRKEKHNLRRLIESRIDDKARYATERLIQEMCRDEPYGIHELGSVEDLRAITNRELARYYRNWIRTVPIDLFVVGDVNLDRTAAITTRVFGPEAGDRRDGAGLPEVVRKRPGRVRRVEESRDVSQGKLVIGYRTSLAATDSGFIGLQYANTILGGGTSSKLFRHVREEAGLAYYSYSTLERLKGLMTIHAGIDPQVLERALRIIRKQVRDMQKGEISAFELKSAREWLIHRLRALEDAPAALIRSALVARMCGKTMSSRQAIVRYRNTTREQVVAAARTVSLDTIYFLRGGRKATGARSRATSEIG